MIVTGLKVAEGEAPRNRGHVRARAAAAFTAPALLALAAVTWGSAPAAGQAFRGHLKDPAGTGLLTETFKNATAGEFTGYNEACLTGAEPLAPGVRPPTGDHPLGGCEAAAVGPVPPSAAAPDGFLRLTDASTDKTAAVLFNQALPGNGGLDVTFQSWQYGSPPGAPSPADGIAFFLVDGAVDLTRPGAFGGSLGYAAKYDFRHLLFGPGVAGGYLGIGLDVVGNYFADTEQRGAGCPAGERSPAGRPEDDASYAERGPNMITVRGPEVPESDGHAGYCFLAATTTSHRARPGEPFESTLPGSLQGSLQHFTQPVTPAGAAADLAPDTRTVNVVLTPDPGARLIVTIDFHDGTGPHEVLDIPAPQPMPRTFKFGFAASTGAFVDVHLIRGLEVRPDEPLPRLDLIKEVAEPRPGHLMPGDLVTYQYVVTNGGNIPITNLVVHDATAGPVHCPHTTLGAGETVTCTATYTITDADAARGHVTDTATAAGDADRAPVESPSSTKTAEITLPPGLVLEKQPRTPGPYRAGQAVRYSYLVTNTGGLTLDGVHVTDDKVTGITCAAASLAPAGEPGDRTTCEGSHVINAADAADGQVLNTAVASGTASGLRVTSPPSRARLLIGPPRLTVTKRVLTPGPHTLGQAVLYGYVVTNTGHRALHDVGVFDDRASPAVCAATTLAPGQSTTCHGTYRVTGADVTARQVTNIAQASGLDQGGNLFLSQLAQATIPVSRFIPVTG